MKSNQTMLLSTLAAFASGFVAGILYQTESCRSFRNSVGLSAREHTRWIEDQLHVLENQVSHIEEQIHNLGDEFSQKIRETVQNYVPDLEVERRAWEVQNREVERELPRMPRA